MGTLVRKATVADKLLTYHILIRACYDSADYVIEDMQLLNQYYGLNGKRKGVLFRLLNARKVTRAFETLSALLPEGEKLEPSLENAVIIIDHCDKFLNQTVEEVRNYQKQMDSIVESINN